MVLMEVEFEAPLVLGLEACRAARSGLEPFGTGGGAGPSVCGTEVGRPGTGGMALLP